MRFLIAGVCVQVNVGATFIPRSTAHLSDTDFFLKRQTLWVQR